MDWYEEDVEQVIKKRDSLSYPPQTIFYGSSSIRLWDNLYEDFKAFSPVNLGFGGSTLEACVYFFNRIVSPVKTAQKLVIYAGDNDLGDGKTPEEVVAFFKQLEALIDEYFPTAHSYFISIKPSIARWNIDDHIRQTNDYIKNESQLNSHMTFVDIYDAMLTTEGQPNLDYFDEDGLHLSNEGYAVWKQILLAQVFAD